MSSRDIIVVGGSAGASGPLKSILAKLPADLPAAVFVVLHIPAQGVGILSTVASSATKLPVQQAENGMVIKNGHLYLAAPDRHLLIFVTSRSRWRRCSSGARTPGRRSGSSSCLEKPFSNGNATVT